MKNVVFGVVVAVVGLTQTVSAGRKDRWPVVVDNANKVAYGSLGDARNSADTVQSIGCSVFYDTANQRNQVSCSATDAAGVSAQCASQDPNLVQIGAAISSNSFVQFRWDATGACTTVFVMKSSSLTPPKP